MATSQSSLETRSLFSRHISQCNGDITALQKIFKLAGGTENDKRSIFEQSFRDVLRDVIIKDENVIQSSKNLIQLAITSAEVQICYHSVPFLLLSDAFDCITLDHCESLFDLIENNVNTWTKPEFFSSGKILLLRMCNDLLRRLSSSQNTVFCGRIQLFLARLFPLSEKSGLNLMSHFNLENVTTYKTKKALAQSKEGVEEGEEMDIDTTFNEDTLASERPIDYNLYQKLWSLQDFFCQPTQCFQSDRWKQFTATVQEVLQSFSSYKLENIPTRKRKLTQRDLSDVASLEPFSSSHYFAKYLTSENLVNLQLSDSHFRRHVLIQLLILFQYLTVDVKFKTANQTLSDAHSLWVTDTTSKVYGLLEETPPNGKQFTEYVKLVLQREETWIAWKNEGCPSFEKSPVVPAEMEEMQKDVKLGDKLPLMKYEKDIGSKELSRLWNLCPDNLEACSSSERIFVPSIDVFLEEALEQTKPDSQIPKEEKLISNPNYRWQALRLLSRESTHFFPYANQSHQIRPLEDYLENVIIQTHKDFQQS